MFDFGFWMFNFSPRLRDTLTRGFLAAVALQRQPYLSVDNLRPTGDKVFIGSYSLLVRNNFELSH
jgi:hypothetical protein